MIRLARPCVLIWGPCGGYSGIGGQLDTTGQTEVVLSMRLEGNDGWFAEPALWRVQVVTEDGVALEPVGGEVWLTEQAEQQWVYQLSGQDRIGFSIESASYCHGWGGPIVVDAVSAQ